MPGTRNILGVSGAAALTAAVIHLAPAWVAKLDPVGGSNVSGSSTVTAISPDSATARITIIGAAGGQYPWHVHAGKCGSEGNPLGNPMAYPVLSVQTGKEASAAATIGFKPAAGQSYSVNVHRSMTDKSVIACGNLSNSGVGMSDSLRPTPPDTGKKPY